MMRKYCVLTLGLMVIFCSCGSSQKFVRNKEAREDVGMMNKALRHQNVFSNIVEAKVETDPVVSTTVDDDAADDPAIWYNPKNHSASIVFGSNKIAGIHSYYLSGKEVQYIPCGKINNVDVRSEVQWGNETVDILAGSNRSNNSIVIFLIDKDGRINDKPDYEIGLGEFSPYEFCLYSDNGNLFAFVNSKNGEILQFRLGLDKNGVLIKEQVRNLKLETQIEGMVADDVNGKLYVGEEQTGIHIFDAGPNSKTRPTFLKGSSEDNPNILFDIEGLALLPPHYLVASSQGNFSFAVFNLKSQTYETSFIIGEGQIDGVQETDGIEISTTLFSEAFPKGVFIAQDGFNMENETKLSQNFKIVDLREILKFLE